MPAAISARGGRLVMSRSSKTMRPPRTGNIPNRALKAVDLPAPFGPITVAMASRRTLNVNPCRTVSRPYPATTPSNRRISSLAKVSLHDFRIAPHVRRIALRDDAALGEPQGAVAQRHDEFHHVPDHAQSRARLAIDALETS